jgi:ketosteroid isomerase-like protein
VHAASKIPDPHQTASRPTPVKKGAANPPAADERTTAMFRQYFDAKTAHDVDRLLSMFDPDVFYQDPVINWELASRDALGQAWTDLFASVPETAGSRLHDVAGSVNGAAVDFTNDAELFGSALHAIGVFDMVDGVIIRVSDYWDGRAFGTAGTNDLRKMVNPHGRPVAAPPTWISHAEHADPVIRSIAHQLGDALHNHDAPQTADLFSSDAVLTERVAGVTVLGRDAIASFLTSLAPRAPWGAGVRIAHVVGGPNGGGVEWIASSPDYAIVGRGVIKLAIEGTVITAATLQWDSSLLPDDRYERFRRDATLAATPR